MGTAVTATPPPCPLPRPLPAARGSALTWAEAHEGDGGPGPAGEASTCTAPEGLVAGAGLLHLELFSASSVRGGPQAHPHPLPACTRAGPRWGPCPMKGGRRGWGGPHVCFPSAAPGHEGHLREMKMASDEKIHSWASSHKWRHGLTVPPATQKSESLLSPDSRLGRLDHGPLVDSL